MEVEEKTAEKYSDLPGDIQGALMLVEDDNFALSEALQHISVLVQQESSFKMSQVNGGSEQVSAFAITRWFIQQTST